MKPVIALVGRPNVGKSTLFNRLTQDARRDRRRLRRPHARPPLRRRGASGEREFIVVDTGGFEPDSRHGIVTEMAKQTRQAVAEADAVIFVVDVRAGLSAQDHDIARYLRKAGKRVRAGGQQGRRHGDVAAARPSSTSSASASRIRSRPRTGRASAACSMRRSSGFDVGEPDDDERRRGGQQADPARGRRPAERRQVARWSTPGSARSA